MSRFISHCPFVKYKLRFGNISLGNAAPAPKHRHVTAATPPGHTEFPWSAGSHPAEHGAISTRRLWLSPRVLPAAPSALLHPRDCPSTRDTSVTHLSRSLGRTGSRCSFSAKNQQPVRPPRAAAKGRRRGMKGGYLLLGEPEVVGIHQLRREQSLSAPVPTAPHTTPP